MNPGVLTVSPGHRNVSDGRCVIGNGRQGNDTGTNTQPPQLGGGVGLCPPRAHDTCCDVNYSAWVNVDEVIIEAHLPFALEEDIDLF